MPKTLHTLEAVVTLTAMQHKVITPTMNFTVPRPNAPSDPVAETKPRPHPIQYAVSTNAAFGGFNAALIFGEKENPLQTRREKPRFIRICSTGKVQDYHQIKQFVPNSELRSIDKSARLLGSAVAIALTNAGIRLQSPDCENIGLFVGQTRISQESVEAFSDSVEARGLLSFSATAFTRMACSYATGVSCRLFGLKGPSTTLSTGADSGLTALVIGADHLAWRDDVNFLLTAAVDEPNKLDDYENGAGSILLTAGAEPTSINLTGWALATDCEAAIIQALTYASLNPEDVVQMDVQGPPTVAGLWAVIEAIDALKSGETGPFLISSKEQGSAGAAVILQNGVKNAI